MIARSPDEHLKCLDLHSSYWAKSLVRRMGFTKRTCTTSKPENPQLTKKKKAKLILQHQSADLVVRHSIPPSLVMNFDQTPLRYAPVANQTLSRKGSKHVAIKVLSFKKSITAILRITFNLRFLPMQLIIVIRNGKIVWKHRPNRPCFLYNLSSENYQNPVHTSLHKI